MYVTLFSLCAAHLLVSHKHYWRAEASWQQILATVFHCEYQDHLQRLWAKRKKGLKHCQERTGHLFICFNCCNGCSGSLVAMQEDLSWGHLAQLESTAQTVCFHMWPLQMQMLFWMTKLMFVLPPLKLSSFKGLTWKSDLEIRGNWGSWFKVQLYTRFRNTGKRSPRAVISSGK